MDPQHSALLLYIACIVNHSVCVQPGLVRTEAFNCEFPIHLGWRGRGGRGAETDVVTRVAARSNGFSCCWQLLVLTAIQKRKKNSGKGSGEREGKGVSILLYLYALFRLFFALAV